MSRKRFVGVKCDNCEKIFVISSDNIQKALCNLKGQSYLITFIYCPHCFDVSVIAIEDNECLELRTQISEYTERIARRLKFKDISKAEQLKELRKSKQWRLGSRIDKLNKAFKGKFEFSDNILSYHE